MASVGHNSYQQAAIGITSGLLLLTTFVVYLRLYIRCILKAGSGGWDDVTVFIAWIMAMGASIATCFGIVSGLGRHIQELTPEQLHGFNLSRFVVIQFYSVGLSFVKLSFLAQFHNSFPTRKIKTICLCFAFFCFMWMIVQSVLYSFSCVPIEYVIPSMSAICIPTIGIWTAISLVNFITDAVIFCIPIKPLRRMSLLKRQRYLLLGIFCLGLFICVISVVRIPIFRQTISSPDPTFTYVKTNLWSLVELEAAIICTCLPVLKPIVARFVRGISSPDATTSPEQPGTGTEHSSKKKRKARRSNKSPLSTDLSGSTLTGRSFFRSLATRDDDAENEQRAITAAAVAEIKDVGTSYRQRDVEKNLATPKTVDVDQFERDQELPLQAPIDFFYPPVLEKATKKPTPIVTPQHLCKDSSLNSSWRAPPVPITPSSPQGSTQRLLHTPISPASPKDAGSQASGLPSARTTNSFFGPSHTPSDDFYSQAILSHACNANSEACPGEVCSICSSELLPEKLHYPALPSPEAQSQDAGTQTNLSRKRTSSTVRRTKRDATVTQSTQTAVPWESSPESSRPSSPQRPEVRTEADLAKLGTIARARERAMQAIADKNYGQVGKVHQGRARIIQVDTSQRRQAAVGLEEMLGLDGDRSPRRPFGPVGPVQCLKRPRIGSGDRFSDPVAAAPRDKVQKMEAQTRPTQQQEGPRNYADFEGISPMSQSRPARVQNTEDQDPLDSSATERRTAGTSWLRLSTDFGV